jgi:hypothetical protein
MMERLLNGLKAFRRETSFAAFVILLLLWGFLGEPIARAMTRVGVKAGIAVSCSAALLFVLAYST